MNSLLKDSRGVSLSIAIFAVLLMVLIVTSIFYFIIRDKRLNEVLDDRLDLDRLNIRVAFLNYFLDRTFEKAVEQAGGNYENFINAYFNELYKYELNGVYTISEMEQVVNQVNNVEIVDGKFILKLELEMVQEGGLDIEYHYFRQFVSN